MIVFFLYILFIFTSHIVLQQCRPFCNGRLFKKGKKSKGQYNTYSSLQFCNRVDMTMQKNIIHDLCQCCCTCTFELFHRIVITSLQLCFQKQTNKQKTPKNKNRTFGFFCISILWRRGMEIVAQTFCWKLPCAAVLLTNYQPQ